MDSKELNKGKVHIYSAFTLAGTSIVAGKILGGEVPVIVSVTLSIVIALIVLIPVHLKTIGPFKGITKKELIFLSLQAITGIVLTRYFTLRGLILTSAINAGLITSLTPGFMFLFSIVIFKERLTLKGVVALILGILGVVIINLGEFSINGRDSLIGSGLILISVICEVSMSIIKKLRGSTIPSLTNAVLLYIISLIFFLPVFLIEVDIKNLIAVDRGYFSALIYYGLFGSALAYIFWSSGVVKVSGVVVSQAFTMIPLTAVVLSPIVLKEDFTTMHFLGVTLITTGFIVSSRGIRLIRSNKP